MCKSQLTQARSGGQAPHVDARSYTKAVWCMAWCPPEQLAHTLNLTF